MDSENDNEVTIVMIHHAISAIRYHSLSKRPDEERVFRFVKELLAGNEIEESIFGEKLRALEIQGKIINKPLRKRNSFSLPKNNPYVSASTSNVSYNQFPSSTPSYPQDLGHDLSFINH